MQFHRGRLFDHVHLRVRDLEWSRRFYQAVLGSLGLELHAGEDHFWADELFVSADGPPGERSYHPGYFAAYVLDPDGNNVEAVYHGPASRSALSVVIETLER